MLRGYGIKRPHDPSQITYRVPHATFGKYDINLPALDRNQLTVRYTKNKRTVQDMPTRKVSDAMSALLQAMLRDKEMGEVGWGNLMLFGEEMKSLSDEEKEFACYFCNRAGVFPMEDAKALIRHRLQGLYERYELVKGEIDAGNNSVELKKELKDLVYELHLRRRISSKEKAKVYHDYFVTV